MLFRYEGWSSFDYFFSAETTQILLKKCYQKLDLEDAEKKGYENCYPFIYYLEHGRIYYKQARQSPLIIRPILLFYGFVHLLKACILTLDPNYPEKTSVLAHGVSSRKRKKQQYRFFEDEVKFQKSGLFPLIAEKMFHMEQLEGEKMTMGALLRNIPELMHLFQRLEKEETFLYLEKNDSLFILPSRILDSFHMTHSRFIDFFQSKTAASITFADEEKKWIKFKTDTPLFVKPSPIKYDLSLKRYCVSNSRDGLWTFPEVLIHYLLLYNLGMIARYETEWWSELIKMMPTTDFPFIKAFTDISLQKSPFLIYQYLMGAAE